ncbi:MAG: DUF5667 domain-containing protein [Candidatus Paceibacterales bacterium]
MFKLSKLLIILITICLGLGLVVLAQEAPVETTEAVNLDENIQPEDLEIADPQLLPDSPFYFLKNWGRRVRSFFAFNPVAKTELESKFANEKLIELKKMIEMKRNPEVLKKAAENYQKTIEKIKRFSERIRQKAEENPRVEKFLDKFTQHQTLHQRLLQRLENQVPSEAFEKIKEARERHLERFKDVMLKLEDKTKIPERLGKNMEKLRGSRFKEFKNLELLDELKEKLPEDIKEKFEERKEKILERLHLKLEELSPEEQEKFKEYVDRISGDKIKHLDILGSLEGKELSEKLKTIIERAREGSIGKIQEKYQEIATPEKAKAQINLAGETLERAKSLIVEKDIKKEEMPAVLRLVQEAADKLETAKKSFDEENYGHAFGQAIASLVLSKNAIRIIEIRGGFKEIIKEGFPVCSLLKIPVCGIDGKTYQNICEVKKAEVKIAYRGECKAEMPCANEKIRVNRNPLLGPTNQICCEGLEEFRVSKLYSICKKPEFSFECKTDEDCPLPRCPGVSSKCVDGKCIVPRCPKPVVCIQVITPAKNLKTGECKEFPTPCDVPAGWVKVDECPGARLKLKQFLEGIVPKTEQ